MAFDLEQLETDAQTANDSASAALVAIRGFRRGKIAGVSYTAGQKTALRSQFDDDARAVKTANDAIIAQLDAN